MGTGPLHVRPIARAIWVPHFICSKKKNSFINFEERSLQVRTPLVKLQVHKLLHYFLLSSIFSSLFHKSINKSLNQNTSQKIQIRGKIRRKTAQCFIETCNIVHLQYKMRNNIFPKQASLRDVNQYSISDIMLPQLVIFLIHFLFRLGYHSYFVVSLRFLINVFFSSFRFPLSFVTRIN